MRHAVNRRKVCQWLDQMDFSVPPFMRRCQFVEYWHTPIEGLLIERFGSKHHFRDTSLGSLIVVRKPASKNMLFNPKSDLDRQLYMINRSIWDMQIMLKDIEGVILMRVQTINISYGDSDCELSPVWNQLREFEREQATRAERPPRAKVKPANRT
jgi:hypothetical protein